jgi:hypothetical protein
MVLPNSSPTQFVPWPTHTQANNVVTVVRHPDKPSPKPVKATFMVGEFGQFQLKSITNTTWYKPGEWLSESVVQYCCEISNWDVTLIENNTLSMIFGILGGVAGAGLSKVVP